MLVVPDDFERRYRVRPWLVESYAEIGSSLDRDFLAAQWAFVGRTRNRGGMGRARKMAVEEDIYLYPLGVVLLERPDYPFTKRSLPLFLGQASSGVLSLKRGNPFSYLELWFRSCSIFS